MGLKVANEGENLNWGDVSAWSGGAVPVSGDDVLLPGRHRFRAGFNQAAVNLDSLKSLEGSSIEFDETMIIDVDSAGEGLILMGRGRGTFEGDFNKVIVGNPQFTATIKSGTCPLVIGYNGAQIIVLDSMVLSGVLDIDDRSYATVGANATEIPDLRVGVGGIVETKRNPEDGYNYGRCTLLDGAKISDGAGGGTFLNARGGVLRQKCNAAVTNDQLTNKGIYDPRGSKAQITITALHSGPGSRTGLYYEFGKVVVTAETKDGVPGGVTSEFSGALTP